MDVAVLGLGCPSVRVTGSLQTTGTYIAKADGSYADDTTTKGSLSFALPPGCLSVSSTPVDCDRIASIFNALGWQTTLCSETNGQCSCALSTEQQGGLGYISAEAPTKGTYTALGNTLTNNDGLEYSYCASGDQLTVTPAMAALSGKIVLQKDGTSGGMGGASGTGGAASGGAGAGGATSSGGAPGGASAGGKGGGGAGGNVSTGGTAGAPGTGGAAGGGAKSTGPCDIYAAANATCVAAHSTVRALFGAYSGNLYQIKRASDGMTKDIPALTAGGFADSAAQDAFCTGTMCTILKVYDQSGHENTVEAEIPGVTLGTGANAHPGYGGQTAANAAQESLTVGGHKVYSLYTRPKQAYWRDGSATGVPTGAQPQGIYIVTSGKHVNTGCCYDYGNGEVSRTYVAGPSMDALYFGLGGQWGTGNGTGPWVMADLEGGVFSGLTTGKNNELMSQTSTYVTAIEKNNGTTEFALKAADATAPALNTYYKGALPGGKNPMKKQGAIVLGSGGDCCYSNNNASEGTFYEGAIVAGYPSDATDAAVHANVVSAGYGK
jgi:hypothetical protein